MEKQKRVLAIHDISCIGKCSLTAALPIISAAGIETAVIPTAVLSTHTGGFENFTYRDLTDDILPIARHWQSLGIEFDAIYTGFLGSEKQVDIVLEVFNIFGSSCLKIVDPAMADDGKMYTTFDCGFITEMKKLCSEADIIVPNITEACFFLGREYKCPPYSKEFVEELVRGLYSEFGAKVVLTGVSFDGKKLGCASLESENGKTEFLFSDKIPVNYPGSGDVFASVLTAAVLSGKSLYESGKIAVEFTANAVKKTFEAKTEPRYGLNFESQIPYLINKLSDKLRQ